MRRCNFGVVSIRCCSPFSALFRCLVFYVFGDRSRIRLCTFVVPFSTLRGAKGRPRASGLKVPGHAPDTSGSLWGRFCVARLPVAHSQISATVYLLPSSAARLLVAHSQMSATVCITFAKVRYRLHPPSNTERLLLIRKYPYCSPAPSSAGRLLVSQP